MTVSFGHLLDSIAAKTYTIFIEHRRVQAASHLAEHLKHRSDADLNRLGIERRNIDRQVRERLECFGELGNRGSRQAPAVSGPSSVQSASGAVAAM